MSFDRRMNRKCYNHEWALGRCALYIETESVVIPPDPNTAGRGNAAFDLKLFCMPRMNHEEDHDVQRQLRGVWGFNIREVAVLPSSLAWQGMTELVNTMYPRIPCTARQFMLQTIAVEAMDAADKAIFLDHNKLWMEMRVEVQLL